MSIQDPGTRPTQWGTIGDHDSRIRKLEALRPCCGDSGGGETLQDEVLAHPCVASFWPMNDSGPGALDLGPAATDLIENPAGFGGGLPVGTQGTYSFAYGQSGPFAGSSSIQFDGDPSGALSRGTCLYYLYPGTNPTTGSYTMFGYALLDDTSLATFFTFWGSGTPQTSMASFSDDINFGAQTSSTFATATATGAAVTAIWLFLAGTYDSATKTFELFINGVSAATATLSTGTNDAGAGYLRFGCAGNSLVTTPTNFLRGRLSSWALFDCVLTADEIANFGTLGGTGAADAGMVLTADGTGGTYWGFPTIEVDY